MNNLDQVNYKLLFESVPGLYLILLPDLTIVAVSDAYLAATLTKKTEILNRNLFDVFPDNPDDPDATGVTNLRASLQFVLQHKTAHRMAVQKYDVQRPDGKFEEKYWSPYNKPVFNEKQEITLIIHRVEDVTEFVKLKEKETDRLKKSVNLRSIVAEKETEIYNRAQEIEQINDRLLIEMRENENLQHQLRSFNIALEEEVKKKTAELTNIFERVTDAFIALDKDFHYTYVNKRTGEMTGKDPAAMIGKSMWDEFPDAIGSATYRAMNKAMAEQCFVSNVDYYPPLDLWQENHIYPSPDGLSVFINDISVQKKAQQKIEREKDFSDSLINSLPGVFYLFDSNGNMLRWNKNFEDVTGYSTVEIDNMRVHDFFDKDEREYVESRIRKVFIEGSADAEANFFTRDGSKIPFYFTGKFIENDGKPCVVGTGINVTEKLKAEEELKRSHQRLRELASHLQDIREEERTSIAREIHDELGQQLTGLKMDISWLKRKIEQPDIEMQEKIKGTLDLTDEAVKTVRRIATQLRPSILDDLGLIAAIEWHSSEFAKRFGLPVSFETGMDEGMKLQPDIATGMFRIYQESLTNVLRHAGTANIASSLEIINGSLVLTITDNGKGFDVEQIRNKKTLGLLGMKERTLIMGGKYEIKSQPGKGTTVLVSVPLTNN